MRGAVTTRPYVSARGVARTRERLSGRDLAIIRQVGELRLMSARQLEAIHFPVSEHDNAAAAMRALGLGPLGQRVLSLEGPRRRGHEPGLRFVDHTLAVAQLVVDVRLAARRGTLELLACQAEPACWREFSRVGGRLVLRPDAFLALGVGAYELRWFIEVDRASESLPVVLRKCRLYADYYQAGVEQAQGGVFPRVCWVVPDAARAERVRQAIMRDRQLPTGLFVVTTSEQAVVTLSSQHMEQGSN